MEIQHQQNSDTYVFKAGEKKTVHFLFLLSDLSAFGDPVKEPIRIRGNYRKCMRILLQNKLNEFAVVLKDGDYFEIGSPIYSRGRTKEDIAEYSRNVGGIKPDPARLDVEITIPAGNAIKVYSIDGRFFTYLVNRNGQFYQTDDLAEVESVASVYF